MVVLVPCLSPAIGGILLGIRLLPQEAFPDCSGLFSLLQLWVAEPWEEEARGVEGTGLWGLKPGVPLAGPQFTQKRSGDDDTFLAGRSWG